MAYQRPSLTSLINTALQNVAGYLGYQPLFSSNEFVLTNVFAGMVDGVNSYIDYCFRQCTPFTATGAYLAAWGQFKGITRNGATAAVGGGVYFTGTAGVTVASGTLLAAPNGLQYATNAQYTIGSSSPVSATCTTPGSAGNAASGIALQTVSSLVGVAAVYCGSAFTGGADMETDSSLRTRILQRFANNVSGGNVNDYKGWALACPGVTRAWPVANTIVASQAGGCVTIFTMFDNTESAYFGFPQGTAGCSPNDNAGNPRGQVATGDLLAVANAIVPYQPVTAFVWCMAPTAEAVNVTVSGLGVSNAWTSGTWTSTPTTAETNILEAIQDVFVLYGTAQGGTLQTSIFSAAIFAVLGASTFSIVAPSAPVTTPVGSLPILGTLTIEV